MTDITIRSARPADGPALRRLAQLDSSHVPVGELLVAEVCGEVVAARGASATIADPFRPTADVVELLWLRRAPWERAATGRRRLVAHARPRVA